MENAMIRITVAGKEHASLIADLSRRTFYDTFAPYNTKENMDQFMDIQFTREQLMAEVGAPRNTFLLAWIENQPTQSIRPAEPAQSPQPVGYARLYETSELPRDLNGTSAIEISRFYSEQHTIGKGVGKALMEACLELGREKGLEWIWLCVWEQNGRAIRFYEKMGFEKFDEHIFILGQDLQHDWKMKRRL
jgi:diamine N-acetyltransferase